MTYHELLRKSKNKAIELNKEESAVVILLIHVSKMENHVLYSKMNEEVDDEVLTIFNTLLDSYFYENKPVQYLTNTEYFYGYEFSVSPNCLIPRRETEELVSKVLEFYDEYFIGEKIDVVDIGTGSGAIAISLALEEVNMSVKASDISEEAIEIAKENAKRLGAEVEFKVGDMLSPFETYKFDILVSNPPYIPQEEYVESLVKDNEPHLALFGGDDGMKFYRIILQNASKILKERNILAFEHAFDKNKEMYELVKEHFPNSKIEQFKDLQGKNRMTVVINGFN